MAAASPADILRYSEEDVGLTVSTTSTVVGPTTALSEVVIDVLADVDPAGLVTSVLVEVGVNELV
jgi:hypothetical protein